MTSINRFLNFDFKTLTDDEIRTVGFLLLKSFQFKGWGNPFNYNRFMEFIQAKLFGYKLTTVGGGSDGINEQNETTEFKATKYLGLTKKGIERSMSFAYNGTTRMLTLEEQKKYCYNKIMRDSLHHWTVVDYESGECLYTIQLTNEQVWSLIWPKWEKSWYDKNAGDPRIGASISTAELKKSGIKYVTITH